MTQFGKTDEILEELAHFEVQTVRFWDLGQRNVTLLLVWTNKRLHCVKLLNIYDVSDVSSVYFLDTFKVGQLDNI